MAVVENDFNSSSIYYFPSNAREHCRNGYFAAFDLIVVLKIASTKKILRDTQICKTFSLKQYRVRGGVKKCKKLLQFTEVIFLCFN